MKNGQPESLAEALLLIEKMKGQLSQKNEKIEKQKEKLESKDQKIREQQNEIREKQVEIERLNELLAHKRYREFAAKSEKTRKINAQKPFEVADENPETRIENPCPSVTVEDEIQTESESRKKSSSQKKKSKTVNSILKSNLPVRTFIQELPEEELNCPNCGSMMKKVREEKSYRVVQIPATEYIEEVIRYVYECPNCVDENDRPVTKSAKEKRIIEKSPVTPSLLAHIFVSKHMMHTPYYCLEDAYNWQGIHFSRQNFCNWQQKIFDATGPLRKLYYGELNRGKYLQFDETPIEIQKQDKEAILAEYWDDSRYRKKKDDDGEDEENAESKARKNCYMWVVLGGEHKVRTYNFRWTRSGKNVLSFLENFEGSVIQSDGYSGYDSAVSYWNENHPEHKIQLCNCNVHSRRPWAESAKATKSKTAKEAVDLYEKIFNRETELRELFDEGKITEEQFLERRQQEVKPLFDNLHEWLLEKKSREILETSKTKQAINYCLNRWENLTRYLNYSYLTPSTNEAERTVRPFTLLRKNSMFYGSGKGAESSCWILTMIETAKIHNLSPEDYLRCVFERAPYCETTADWKKLLPWNIEITPFQPRGQWKND